MVAKVGISEGGGRWLVLTLRLEGAGFRPGAVWRVGAGRCAWGGEFHYGGWGLRRVGPLTSLGLGQGVMG